MMQNKVLILGGYGNFGKRISIALAKASIPIIIAGRDRVKAEELKLSLCSKHPGLFIETAIFDVHTSLPEQLIKLAPKVVVNTCGPFQNSNYLVAEICIYHKIHYIDLADGRDFVNGISRLDVEAKESDVLVVSGASTVPGLSSAVLEVYKNDFSEIDSLVFGVSPGQRVERGLATTRAILTYVGRLLKPFAGHHNSYGWQDIYRQEYPELGKRWMANCDIPDLDLLAEHYKIKSIKFSAGMESGFLHLGIWVLSWCVRLGLSLNLSKHAEFLLRMSHIFDSFGTQNGGMHMIIDGKDAQGMPHAQKWFIIAKDGDGPQIPTIPAIVLAKKLIIGQEKRRGAKACVGLVTLAEYKAELEGFCVTYHENL
jgi:hypothetical protein